MFVILLISSALGACKDQGDIDKCLKESKCVWGQTEPGTYTCVELTCDKYPMRGICDAMKYCQWTDGKCDIINCARYPGDKCPTADCTKYPASGGNVECYPKNVVPKDSDTCTATYKLNLCKSTVACDVKDDKCVKDSCFAPKTTESKCDSSKCKVINLTMGGVEVEYCVKKYYDPDNEYCFIYDAGAGCDGSYACMTDGDKCKEDKCLDSESTKEECEKTSGCKYDVPDFLKDYFKEFAPKDQKLCYHKDHVFAAGALGVLPALIQNKIFQLASALLLFLLI